MNTEQEPKNFKENNVLELKEELEVANENAKKSNKNEENYNSLLSENKLTNEQLENDKKIEVLFYFRMIMNSTRKY